MPRFNLWVVTTLALLLTASPFPTQTISDSVDRVQHEMDLARSAARRFLGVATRLNALGARVAKQISDGLAEPTLRTAPSNLTNTSETNQTEVSVSGNSTEINQTHRVLPVLVLSEQEKRQMQDLSGCIGASTVGKCTSRGSTKSLLVASLFSELSRGGNPLAFLGGAACSDPCLQALRTDLMACSAAPEAQAMFDFVDRVLCSSDCGTPVDEFLGAMIALPGCFHKDDDEETVSPTDADPYDHLFDPSKEIQPLRPLEGIKEMCENCCLYDVVMALYALPRQCLSKTDYLLGKTAEERKRTLCEIGTYSIIWPVLCAPDLVACADTINDMSLVAAACPSTRATTWNICDDGCNTAVLSYVSYLEPGPCCFNTVVSRIGLIGSLKPQWESYCAASPSIPTLTPVGGVAVSDESLWDTSKLADELVATKKKCPYQPPEACEALDYFTEGSCVPEAKYSLQLTFAQQFPQDKEGQRALRARVRAASAEAAGVKSERVAVRGIKSGSVIAQVTITKTRSDHFNPVAALSKVKVAASEGIGAFNSSSGFVVDKEKNDAALIRFVPPAVMQPDGGSLSLATGLNPDTAEALTRRGGAITESKFLGSGLALAPCALVPVLVALTAVLTL